MERLQKFIANCGVSSRRAAEKLITDGKVTVNGKIVTELGTCIDEKKDSIKVNGKLIKPSKTKIYIMLNKPEGYVTTVKDQFARPTVLDLVPLIKEKIVPVGRLDYNSKGLLLLSNDGDFVYKLTHPKNKISKTYEAKVKGIPTQEELDRLRKGVVIDGKKTNKAIVKVKRVFDKNALIEVTIFEGRNRQVRKMFDVIHHEVISLKRTSIGSLKLGLLKEGEYRSLRPDELKKFINNI